MGRILTSWHKQGIEEGKIEGKIEGKSEGKIEALRNIILKQARKKLNGIAISTESKIMEINNPELLENIVENILDIQSEEELIELINS